MPFLTLNGWTIPVLGGEIEPREIGGTQRSQNGSLFKQRVAIKRRWRFTTKPLTQADALGLMSLILGEGLKFSFFPNTNPQSFDDDVAAASDSGLTPSVSNVSTVESNTAADGNPVKWLVTAPSTYRDVDWALGNGASASCEYTSGNLLTAAQRDCENTPSTDFVKIGGATATLSDDTSNYWQGSKSLKIVTTATGTGGAATGNQACLTNRLYHGSLYAKGESGSEDLNLIISDNDGGNPDTSVLIDLPSAKTWARIYVAHTTGASATQLNLYVQDSAASKAQTWYCDGWQLEASSHLTQWYDGTRSAAGKLRYDPSKFEFGKSSVTVTAFATGSALPVSTGSTAHLFDIGSNSDLGRFTADISPVNNNYFRASVLGPYGSAYLSVNTGVAYDRNWHHFACVYDVDNTTLLVYVDGALVGQDNTPSGDAPNFTNLSGASIGSRNDGALPLTGHAIGEVNIIPHALSASQIAGLASQTQLSPRYPQILADGDFFDHATVVMGRVSRSSYIGVQRATTWQNNNNRVSFELEEV